MFETSQGAIKPIVYVGIIQEHKLLMIDYKTAPNPEKRGWWIPAPELEFGEDPTEKAGKLIADFGFDPAALSLHNVESFILPGGWHLIYHYICKVQGVLKLDPNINKYRWVSIDDLQSMNDVAHGKWEIGVATSYLLTDVTDSPNRIGTVIGNK